MHNAKVRVVAEQQSYNRHSSLEMRAFVPLLSLGSPHHPPFKNESKLDELLYCFKARCHCVSALILDKADH